MKKKIPIYSFQDFEKICQNPEGDFILKRDIDKEDYKNGIISFVKSIFSSSFSFPISEFEGHFYGNGHSLIGFKCPIFESNNGIIENLNVENVEVEEDKTSTILEKCNTGVLTNTNNGKIKNCSIKNLKMDIRGKYLGGICEQNNGVIRNCEVLSASITCSSQLGGICNMNKGEILECNFEGEIELKNMSTGTGLIVGTNMQKIEKCSVENSEMYVESKRQKYVLGGLVGRNNGEIKDSYSYETDIYLYYSHETDIHPDRKNPIGNISGKNLGRISNCHHQKHKKPVGVDRGKTEVYEINDISNIWNEILLNKI